MARTDIYRLAFDLESRIKQSLGIASRYGGIDGEHHTRWVIDQMVRSLCGTPEAYAIWVKNQREGEDGPETYTWDEGIPP